MSISPPPIIGDFGLLFCWFNFFILYKIMIIMAPISIGELIDKITILSIKLTRIVDEDKKKNVLNEFNELNNIPQLSTKH